MSSCCYCDKDLLNRGPIKTYKTMSKSDLSLLRKHYPVLNILKCTNKIMNYTSFQLLDDSRHRHAGPNTQGLKKSTFLQFLAIFLAKCHLNADTSINKVPEKLWFSNGIKSKKNQ
jgi:hypothetical protein